jgi:phosphohistidine phosphatase
MKTLLILRHAKSSWDHPNLSDHDRPLNRRGEHDAPRMGQLLFERDLLPDLILSSTARRAHDTVSALTEACGYAGEVLFQRALYHAGVADYLETLRLLSDEVQRVLVVGHNPTLEELLYHLTDESEALPTAALALIRLPIASWHQLTEETQGELIGLWTPRSL